MTFTTNHQLRAAPLVDIGTSERQREMYGSSGMVGAMAERERAKSRDGSGTASALRKQHEQQQQQQQQQMPMSMPMQPYGHGHSPSQASGFFPPPQQQQQQSQQSQFMNPMFNPYMMGMGGMGGMSPGGMNPFMLQQQVCFLLLCKRGGTWLILNHTGHDGSSAGIHEYHDVFVYGQHHERAYIAPDGRRTFPLGLTSSRRAFASHVHVWRSSRMGQPLHDELDEHGRHGWLPRSPESRPRLGQQSRAWQQWLEPEPEIHGQLCC